MHTYLTGEQVTLADVYLFVVLTWFSRMGIELAEWLHVAKYFSALKNRSEIQQTLNTLVLNVNELLKKIIRAFDDLACEIYCVSKVL